MSRDPALDIMSNLPPPLAKAASLSRPWSGSSQRPMSGGSSRPASAAVESSRPSSRQSGFVDRIGGSFKVLVGGRRDGYDQLPTVSVYEWAFNQSF